MRLSLRDAQALVVNMTKAGYEKGVSGAHWGMFQQLYGGGCGTCSFDFSKSWRRETGTNPFRTRAT